MKMMILVFVNTLFIAITSPSMAEGFDINELPVGHSVTLPHPATTLVPLSHSIKLTSSDMPQAIKLSSVYSGSGKAPIVKVAIYDANAQRVKYVDVRPGSHVLYTFKDLSSIRLVPDVAKGEKEGVGRLTQLQIESNKPLGISR